VGLAGLSLFVLVLAERDVTPFVVGRHVGLGALVFVGGRLVLVALHELAHGLVSESFGRRIVRAGVKTVLVFPYAFVDTSDAWFEPRRRRLAVSLAGPASDLVLGGAFAIACAATTGRARDVLFQLALAGYVGGLFNLNPLLDRDGYHVVADLLGQPSLRDHSRLEVRRLLAGHRRRHSPDTRALVLYGAAALGWSVCTVGFAIAISLRYYHRLTSLAPPALVWTLLASFYLVLMLPLGFQIGRPLWERSRTPVASAEREVDA
jgi:putative peptide zinc metalloprotease protein